MTRCSYLASSLKRLCILFEGRGKFQHRMLDWVISPVREQEFIEALKVADPDIYINVPIKKGIWRFGDWDI